MPAVKIATCNYCSTRAALVMTEGQRHELACSNCGAPLNNLKIMPRPKQPPAAKPRRPQPVPSHVRAMSKPRKRREYDDRRRKRKSVMRDVLEEIWDFVEDIFD